MIILKQIFQKGVVLVLCLLTVSMVMAGDSKPILVTDSSFGCIREMTPVRGFFVDSLTGNLDETVKVAKSDKGGVYPAGSVVQLVPGEVMVKHSKGTSPKTNDWEFFELAVSNEGGKIAKRGFEDVVNKFGGKCLDCHIKAEPQWDLICETGHGCDPIPLTRDLLDIIQKTDPRCQDNPKLSEEEMKKLMMLQKMLKPASS